jgi:hypothetical protein
VSARRLHLNWIARIANHLAEVIPTGIPWEVMGNSGNFMGTTGEFNGHKNGIFFWDLVWEDIRINGIEWEEHGVFLP